LTGYADWFYGAVAGAMGAIFVYLAWRVRTIGDEDEMPAKRLFAFSIFYLFTIFAALLAETVVRANV
jgi:protoheme IX farnesyltransferase